MSTPPAPSLKSLPATPAGPRAAAPRVPGTAVGEPKGAAVGVRTAFGSGPRADDGRFPVAWLCISAPRGAVPTATSKCLCGRDRSAVGHTRVLALIADHTGHRDECPLRTTQEERAAA
ncbi:hypothetical protein [Streptomyces sp. NPDC088794]|uniref:hypothetical protein n=1 Tax=Streptomyces sp. NPDC088794 TaxID=3365902 RepID=UPI00381B879C